MVLWDSAVRLPAPLALPPVHSSGIVGFFRAENAAESLELWPEEKRNKGDHARFAVSIPRIKAKFTGTGDITTALILAWSHELPRAMPEVCRRMVCALRAVCLRTKDAPAAGPPGVPSELRIIACKREIEDPPPAADVTVWGL